MKEPHAADALEDNLDNPMAPILYAVSTLHCMTVSLAHGGAGIGTVFGEQLARRMLADAGFVDVEVHPAPGDPGDAVYLARKGTVTAVWARRLAWGAIVAQLVFVGSWLVGGVIERHGYSVASDDISDLGALTAHHPTLVLVAFGISGALTIAFALGAVRPALGLGGWLLAVVAPGPRQPERRLLPARLPRCRCRLLDEHRCFFVARQGAHRGLPRCGRRHDRDAVRAVPRDEAHGWMA